MPAASDDTHAGPAGREIILASTSKYRAAQLTQLGLTFRAIAPGIDESELQSAKVWQPAEVARELSLRKAAAVAGQWPDAIVIGGDQIPAHSGRLLTKPGNRAANLAQLSELSGSTHDLLTAVTVICGGSRQTHVDHTRLTMRLLTTAEQERYIDFDQPWDCAGGYRIEGQGIALFERIESQDHSAILGLPLIALTTMLRTAGVCLP